MLRAPLSVLATLALAAVVNAQVTTTGPFTGTWSEGFENLTTGLVACVPGRVFSNHGDLCTPGHVSGLITFGWLQSCSIFPHNGSDGLYGSVNGFADFTFDAPVQRFGGYFGNNSGYPGGVAKLYDVGNNLLASLPITAPECSWAWNGWDAGAGPKIKHIEVYGNDPLNNAALLQMDDMEIDPPGSNAWTNVGNGKAGVNGMPVLAANGSLAPSSANTLFLTHAAGNTTATLVFGMSLFNAPFKGGVLVPFPLTTIPLATSAAGAASLPFTFPAGIPGGLALVFQFWIHDTSASFAFAASNGLVGVTP